MNPTQPQNPHPRNRAFKQLTAVGLSLLTLAGLSSASAADGNWTGGAADNNWDNLSNWSADPSGAAAYVNTNNNRPIVTANNTVVIPNDIKVGASPGTTGRVDVISGTLNYVYWSFVGDWDGNGTLNIADTATSGGTVWEWGTQVSAFDLSSPEAPVTRNTLWFPGYAQAVAATDRLLFIATQDSANWSMARNQAAY